MPDNKQKATRATPLDALALPHVVEAIATSCGNHQDLESFLVAVPPSLWTPALTAFLDCKTVMPSSVRANWPHIELHDIDLPPSVLARLAATLPLHPRMELLYPVGDAAPLARLIDVLGPALSGVELCILSDRTIDGRGKAISNLLLQRCPRLRHVSIFVGSSPTTDMIELNDLLAVVAHPHVHDLYINLQRATGAPRLGHHLASWLSTAPATKLNMSNVSAMDADGVIAFCNALQTNSTLQELVVSNVPSLGGFHGRTLPVSLETLTWGVCYRVVDQTVTDLATAVGPTRLKRLDCSVFGRLAKYRAAAPMLERLQCLMVSELNADEMGALIAGLPAAPALTTLSLHDCILSLSAELLMETLATKCVRLGALVVIDRHLTSNGFTAVLSGVVRLPYLTSLILPMRLSDVLNLFPALAAAGRHLHYLDLSILRRPEGDLERRAIYQALTQAHDVPFVLQSMPKDMDNFVADALSPCADRCHQCDLIL
ncbi:hypothetical protein SDRG_09712 [Saprolegnia diclina VS20]|uniref:F-box domain-containing protein n=1 Tax=Saprolegnia diclina (strain VS20) TaxID=1156394 RepID=T0QGI1_SAPDV|nr:hypothetical protein SDRG_09712 [Saprolegnia diclina VS20]EQC32740.1 hypothetical protein SDRG_09712 [Saprolegnia diclina VS20]|eukprot:XP_008613884.1 hypothetical protein SDRG_09712 [Saprolegnia diclina VS20]